MNKGSNSAEGVINNYEEFDLCNLRFRNPNNFIAGSLHNHFVEWEKLSPDKQILQWVKNGVDNFLLLLTFTMDKHISLKRS
jgi:hypothetical protein